jgi:hypothetical protein
LVMSEKTSAAGADTSTRRVTLRGPDSTVDISNAVTSSPLNLSPALNTIYILLRRRPSPKSESAARISAEYAQSNACGSYGRPRPCTSAVTNAPISVNSFARPRIGGVASRWPPTSKRPVEGPTRCPVYRLLDCHCSARHCRHPPVRSQPRPQVFTQFRGLGGPRHRHGPRQGQHRRRAKTPVRQHNTL